MALADFFFDRVTDEVRQQMDGVLALVQRLNRQPLGADAEACLAGVAEAAMSVRRVLESTRELKSASGADLSLTTTAHRLRDLMDHVQERWQTRAVENGVILLVSYDGDPHAMATIDGARLVQVFDGFIAQAVAGARRGGVEATLKVVGQGDTVRLEGRVRDGGDRFGAGPDAYDLREIEARFGLETALGVALGQRIIEAMGGAVRHEANRGLGETVVFELTAPAACEPVEAPAANSARAAHILIVDDNATNRMVAETLCEMFECTSETAADGIEAVDAARTGRFDLILMDIKMPRMDGVAASKAIRNLAGRPGRVPIIALTANADPEDVASYLAAGMNGVVEKPMKPEHLLQALQAALGDGRASAA